MNERIKELAISNGIYDCLCDPYDILCNGDRYGSVMPDMVRFAELIIKECIQCSDGLAKHYINNHPEQEQALLLSSIADFSSEIKKRFGVEE